MSRSIATFAVVADSALAESDGLRDLVLGLSGLFHVRNYFTVFRTEAGVFVINNQFVAKPD